jgi:sulfhydrogenase subunit beta (sulfur reductase)
MTETLEGPVAAREAHPGVEPRPLPRSLSPVVLERGAFNALLETLQAHRYEVIGPRVADQAVVYAPVHSADELPLGYTDSWRDGQYRVSRSELPHLFGYTQGVQSWKPYLYPPRTRLLSSESSGQEVTYRPEDPSDAPRYAFVGVRACELAAIHIQDRVFLQGPYPDPHYRARRSGLFIVGVNCTRPGGTCFCSSMGSGPAHTAGFDLAMTEVLEAGRHYFVLEAGSAPGRAVLNVLPVRAATPEELGAAARATQAAADAMGPAWDTRDLPARLAARLEDAHWEDVAKRCLNCANCTMMCPTCFCATIEDSTDLSGTQAERWRRWDSCFAKDFSYIHGGSIRKTGASRYRQWLMHKLSWWHDQFGGFGCVGCGRCTTWCPAGINIKVEAQRLSGACG